MEPDFPEEIVQEINMMEGWYGATKEMSIAYVLGKYNSGIALIKQNSSSQFKKINIKESIDPNGEKHYRSDGCQ